MENRNFFEKWRHFIQAAFFAVSNGYMRGFATGKIYTGNTKVICFPGLNCYSCPGALGACPIGSLQTVLGSNSYRISLYVFGFLSLFGTLLGRAVCGFLCPFGLVQDLMYKIPFKIKKKNLPGHKYLKYMRYVVLAVFVVLLTSLIKDVTGTGVPWFCEWICPSGTLFAGLPLIVMNREFQEAIGPQFFWKLAVLIVILIGSVIYDRPFCKYLCPLGALYGVFNPVSTLRLVVDQDKCIRCGMCQQACGADIRTFENPNSPDCIRCMKCVSACPVNAIESTWTIGGRRIESRLLPNEETGENPQTLWTVLLAVAAVLGGAGTVLTVMKVSLFSVYLLYQQELYSGFAVLTSTVFSLVKVTISVILIITGVLLYTNRNDRNELRRAGERFKTAFRIYAVGLLIYVPSLIFALSLASSSITNVIMAPFPVIGILLLMLLAKMTADKAEGKKVTDALWWVLYLVTLAIAVYGCVMGMMSIFT